MSYKSFSDGDIPTGGDFNNNYKHGYWDQAIYEADTGADDAYSISVTPAPTSYLAGMRFKIKVTTANTGAATLDVNSLGAKTIKKNVSQDLETGDILANQVITVEYDGTNFILLNPANVDRTVVVSSNDTTRGYLNGKIVAGEGVDLTENNDGANETLTISGEDASTTNKGIASFNSSHFSVSSGAVSLDITSDDITEGSTNLYQYSKVYTGVANEEANTTIIATDLRNTFIEWKFYCQIVHVPLAADNIFSTGFFYTASGIAAPAGTDSYSNSSGFIFDASQDTASLMNTDAFLYCDSTTGYLTLHIGTLDGTYDNLRYFLLINRLKDGN